MRCGYLDAGNRVLDHGSFGGLLNSVANTPLRERKEILFSNAGNSKCRCFKESSVFLIRSSGIGGDGDDSGMALV